MRHAGSIGLLGLVVLAGGCSRPSQTAEELFAKAEAANAEERFEQGLSLIPSEAVLVELRASPELRNRFAVLHGELLSGKADYAAAIERLGRALPPGAPAALDRRRRRTLGMAMCRGAKTAPDRERALAVLDGVLADAPAGSLEAGEIELRRGTCLQRMGRMEEAERAFGQTLLRAKEGGDALLEARSESGLGNLCATGERFDEAAAHSRRAHAAAERAGAAGKNVARRATDNLGWHYLELGDYERAQDTLRRFQPLNDRERVVNEVNQARAQEGLGDMVGAAQHFERALAAARAMGDRKQQLVVLQGLAGLALGTGKWFEAAKWNGEARELIASLKQPDLELVNLLMEARIQMGQGNAGGAEGPLQKILGKAGAPRNVLRSAHLEMGKLRAMQRNAAAAEVEFQKAMAIVEDARGDLAREEDRISYLSGRMEVYREAMLFQLQRNRTAEALRVAERSRARELQDRAGRRTTRNGATVFFYWLDDPVSHLWVVNPGGAAKYYRLAGAREIQDLVERHNEFLLRARNPLTDGGREARQLFEILVKPALGELKGRRVLVSPDGALHGLNFETLIAPGPDHYWLEDVEVSVVPGLTGAPAAGRSGPGRMLLAGDAKEDEAGFAPLRHAGEELDRIATQMGGEPLRGAAATPGRVKAALAGGPEYVHFAAHAVPNRLRPLESAILLSKEGGGNRLYARDLVKTRLNGVRMVTLSACTAAGAKAYRGEGLVGFAWAFLGAGAENVVASLWAVDDASTPQLMEQMYRQLQLGRAPGEALREAKLVLLRSGTALQKPYFWGAFLHFGR